MEARFASDVYGFLKNAENEKGKKKHSELRGLSHIVTDAFSFWLWDNSRFYPAD